MTATTGEFLCGFEGSFAKVAKHEKTCARSVVFKSHARADADSQALKKLKSMNAMIRESES